MPDQPPQELLTSAEAGDPEAQNALGRFYAETASLVDGADMAEAWFRRAADQGLARAKHNLGVLHFYAGRRDQGLEWFRAAASAGWMPSVLALGAIAEQDGQKKEAVRLYDIAAERGNAEAQDALGRMWFELETPQGYEYARILSQQAAAQGVAAAETRLGTIYHEGLGVPRDPPRAAACFLRAARSGHAGARLMIGVAYHVGAGVAVDLVESAYWLSLIAAENDVARTYLRKFIDPVITEEQKAALAAKLGDAV